MMGAKVNNRIVTLDHVLKKRRHRGDFDLQNAKGPSRDWMKIAKSNEARSKIRQWFKRKSGTRTSPTAAPPFDAELRHCGIAMKDVLTRNSCRCC